MRGVFDQSIPHDKVLLGQLETTIKNFDPGITRPVKKTDHNSFSNPLLFFKDSLRNLNFVQSYPQYDSVDQRIFCSVFPLPVPDVRGQTSNTQH